MVKNMFLSINMAINVKKYCKLDKKNIKLIIEKGKRYEKEISFSVIINSCFITI